MSIFYLATIVGIVGLLLTPGLILEEKAIVHLRPRLPDVSGLFSFNLCALCFDIHIPRFMRIDEAAFPPESLRKIRALPLRKRLYAHYVPCWLYQAFVRHFEDGWNYGFGILQIGGRHLAYVGGDFEEGS